MDIINETFEVTLICPEGNEPLCVAAAAYYTSPDGKIVYEDAICATKIHEYFEPDGNGNSTTYFTMWPWNPLVIVADFAFDAYCDGFTGPAGLIPLNEEETLFVCVLIPSKPTVGDLKETTVYIEPW